MGMNLCARCDRAYAIPGKGCSWIRHGIPVEGWTAEDSYRKTQTTHAHSYCIKACPLYVPDPPRKAAEDPPKRRDAGCRAKRYSYKGRWMTIREIAFEHDLNDGAIIYRLGRGLTIEEAVDGPTRTSYKSMEG